MKGWQVPCSFVLAGWIWPAIRGPIDAMDLQLTALDDSSEYFVYRYTAINPPTSTQGVAAVRLNVSASPGMSAVSLPATGRFLDGSAVASPLPVAPHAQVGPISPSGWQASLDRMTPHLDWYGVNGRMFDHDSIAPGDSLPGLGIRSTYLPAIREVGAVPTWQSCCQEPWGTSEDNPMRAHRDPEYFMITSYAIAPGYRPEEITINLLQNQLNAICSEPLWLTNSSLCSEFGNLLLNAYNEYHLFNDPYDAALSLSDLRDRVDAEQAQMEPEAYWLLHYNVRQAYANVVPPLKLTCAPESVVKAAAQVSCGPTPPPGVPFEITGWKFVGGSSGEFQVTSPAEPPATWAGLMVVGGPVWVYGDVDGAADSASTTVVVTPRQWAVIAMADTIDEWHQAQFADMPPIPAAQEDLAHYHGAYASGLSSLLLERRSKIVHAHPDVAVRLGLLSVLGVIDGEGRASDDWTARR